MEAVRGKVIGRWAYTVRASEAEEMIRDLSNGAALVLAPGNVRRLPGGRGWRVWDDGGGYTNLTEFAPEECDAIAREAEQSAEARRAEEDRLREESRAARELGPASMRAPR